MMTSRHFGQLNLIFERDSKSTLQDIDVMLAVMEGERAELLHIQQEIVASLPAEGGRETREQMYLKENVRADLMLVVHGVGRGDGVTNPRLAERVGQLGLADLDRYIGRLNARREAMVGVASGPRLFRYTGKALRHQHEGRDLQPGDVVPLTETQAAAWADRFEAVTLETETVDG